MYPTRSNNIHYHRLTEAHFTRQAPAIINKSSLQQIQKSLFQLADYYTKRLFHKYRTFIPDTDDCPGILISQKEHEMPYRETGSSMDHSVVPTITYESPTARPAASNIDDMLCLFKAAESLYDVARRQQRLETGSDTSDAPNNRSAPYNPRPAEIEATEDLPPYPEPLEELPPPAYTPQGDRRSTIPPHSEPTANSAVSVAPSTSQPAAPQIIDVDETQTISETPTAPTTAPPSELVLTLFRFTQNHIKPVAEPLPFRTIPAPAAVLPRHAALGKRLSVFIRPESDDYSF